MIKKYICIALLGFVTIAANAATLPRGGSDYTDSELVQYGGSESTSAGRNNSGSRGNASATEDADEGVAGNPLMGGLTGGGRLPGSGKVDGPVAQVAGQAFIPAVRAADYAANAQSNVFGANLFSGAFAKAAPATFNPDYAVAIGDSIRVRIWGGYDFDSTLTVDPHGMIFLPHCGPLKIVGTRNRDVQATVGAALRKVFSSRVSIYANLEMGQPVRIYVAGFVRHPGMYEGTGGDGILKYLDLAGGIDPERGTFLNVQIKRGKETRANINLYRFYTNGEIDTPQLADGDVIFVGPRQNEVTVNGLASNARLFEFVGESQPLSDIVAVARPDPRSTNVRIVRSRGTVQNVEYYSVADAASVRLYAGDTVTFTADKQQGTITVRVEGEHVGPQEYVVPYGTDLATLMAKVEPSTRSDLANLQLFRESVRDKQAKLLNESLTQLQNSVLTARSGTNEEAQLRQREASLVLQWVQKARNIKPRGQIVVGNGPLWKNVVLESGDLINVPPRDGMVLVGGEVLFPNTMIYRPNLKLDDYIEQAGGFTQNADSSRTIIAHEDGTFVDSRRSHEIRPGDELMVLPKVDFKTQQFAKDLFTILYQIAISAKIAIGL